jgi:hypothetical protein
MYLGDYAIVENNRMMLGAISGGRHVTLQGNIAGLYGAFHIKSGILKDNTLVKPVGDPYNFPHPELIIDGGGNVPALAK